jgi:hypothetical protein
LHSARPTVRGPAQQATAAAHCPIKPTPHSPTRPSLASKAMPAVFARSQNNKDAHPLPLSHRREGPTGSSPSSRSPSPCLARRGKREGTETRSWRGRDSLCPCSRRARQATEPAPHTSYTHATLPHAQRARDLTMAAQEHASGACHPATSNRRRNSIWHHQIESRLFRSP